MLHEELLVKIEELRLKLINHSIKEAGFDEQLRISQELDKYIAEYQRTIMQGEKMITDR